MFTFINSSRINDLAVKLSKDKPGSRRYLGVYKKALSRLEKKLTEEDRRKYRETAKKWSEGKLPRNMQQE